MTNTQQQQQRDFSQLAPLMRDMGSRVGFDPMPPDQHAWPLKLGVGTYLHKLWSWMCAHTIAFGYRSPYAVDEKGKPLFLEDAARDLEIDVPNVRRAWRQGEDLGIFRRGSRETKGYLYLCGEVRPMSDRLGHRDNSESDGDSDTPEVGRIDGEENMYRLFSPYLRLQIERLAVAKRTELLKQLSTLDHRRRRVIADVTEATRSIFDQEQDTLFARFGVKVQRADPEKRPPDPKRESREKRVKALIPQVQKFVQTFFAFGANEVSTCPENEHVQTVRPYLLQRDIQSTTTSSDAPRKQAAKADTRDGDGEVTMIAEELDIDRGAARLLLDGCRSKDPYIAVGRILDLVAEKLTQLQPKIRAGKIQNPVGLIIRSVPEMIPNTREMAGGAR